MNKKLTEKQISIIVEFLKEEKPLLEEYRWLLFEGKWETELIYAYLCCKNKRCGCFDRDNGCSFAES